MTGGSWVLLAIALAVAAVDWAAVHIDKRPLEYLCKPLTMVAVIALALSLSVGDATDSRNLLVVGLALSLVGDVFLMLPDRERFFVPGLVSFLLGHLAYIPALLLLSFEVPWFVGGLVIVALGVATVGRQIVRGVKEAEPRLVVPVVAYIGVISVMVVAAIATSNPFAIVGAILFYVSDSLIAINGFIKELPYGRLSIMVTYHLAQLGLVLALV